MKNERIKENRQKEEDLLMCVFCGKGHISVVMIGVGNIECIKTCTVCGEKETVRKVVE